MAILGTERGTSSLKMRFQTTVAEMDKLLHELHLSCKLSQRNVYMNRK